MDKRIRFTVVAALLAGCAAEPVDSGDPGATGPGGKADSANELPRYLALGDSVAFGWDPLVEDATKTYLFEGYPEKLARNLDLDLVNASCPGEATGGFLSPDGADNGCREKRELYPLHADYDGTQMDFALDALWERPDTALVTIDLGGNDLSLLNDRCAGDVLCFARGVPGLLIEIGSNLGEIYDAIRYDAGYEGPLVVVTYYAFDYNNLTEKLAIRGLNAVIKERAWEAGAIIADAYAAFEEASRDFDGEPCAAGLLIPLADGTCDRHPTPEGQELIAATIRAALEAEGAAELR